MILGISYWYYVIDNVIKRHSFVFEVSSELWLSVNNFYFKSVRAAERLSVLNLNADVMLHDVSDVS